MDEKRTYTAEDIMRYLEGKMSPAEMHALEEAALDDPFLADAIQGADVFRKKYPDADFSNDVEALRRKVVAKRERSRVKPLLSHWWKAAAVLFIVFSGIGLIFLINEKNNFSQKELARKEEHPFVPPVTIEEKDSQTIEPRKVEKKHETIVKPAPQKKIVPADDNESAISPPQVDTVIAPSPSAAEKAPASRASKRAEEEPVAVNLNSNTGATPDGGWDAFNKYISANKKITTSDSAITGTEIISFLINKKGRPGSFSIIQSLSAAHDSLSIRLLRNGPSWKPAEGEKRAATISLTF